MLFSDYPLGEGGLAGSIDIVDLSVTDGILRVTSAEPVSVCCKAQFCVCVVRSVCYNSSETTGLANMKLG